MSEEEPVDGETRPPAALPAGGLGAAVDGKLPACPSSVKRAAAARVKYAIHPDGHRVCLPPLQVGFHSLNRNGIGCNGNRCDQLLGQVLGHFDYREACHDAVAIEETPGERVFWTFN